MREETINTLTNELKLSKCKRLGSVCAPVVPDVEPEGLDGRPPGEVPAVHLGELGRAVAGRGPHDGVRQTSQARKHQQPNAHAHRKQSVKETPLSYRDF